MKSHHALIHVRRHGLRTTGRIDFVACHVQLGFSREVHVRFRPQDFPVPIQQPGQTFGGERNALQKLEPGQTVDEAVRKADRLSQASTVRANTHGEKTQLGLRQANSPVLHLQDIGHLRHRDEAFVLAIRTHNGQERERDPRCSK